MKLLITTCAVLALGVSTPLAGSRVVAQDQAGKKVALLVGVNKYDKRLFNDLSYAERDVEELAAVLEKGGYEVHLLTGGASGAKRATLKNIQATIESLLKDRTKRDLMLVGLAGHGLQIEVTSDGKLQAESFFCPVDAEAGNAKTMLAMGQLFDQINRRGGGRNLVLVDACREDPTRGRGMDGSTVKTLPEGVAVLFGCVAGQKTYETEKAGGGHGVFFHTVLEGLRGGAKKNDTGELTWSSMVDYVTENVETELDRYVGKTPLPQTPNLVTNLRGRSPIILPQIETGFGGSKAGEEKTLTSLNIKFCWCPPGRFTMGSPADEADRGAGEDQVTVLLSCGFWLGKFEVTQGQWTRLMGTSLREQRDKAKRSYSLFGEGATHPMYYVSDDDAIEFCRKLTEQERRAGRLPGGWEYSLPTEAQWEYACRAGTKTATAFGDKLSSDQANFDGNYPYNGADKGEDLNRTTKVGSYKANAWGLHDMHGNVYEWCRDWCKDDALPGGTDPEVTEKASERVLRGGSWEGQGRYCRSACRGYKTAGSRRGNYGFRMAAVQSGK